MKSSYHINALVISFSLSCTKFIFEEGLILNKFGMEVIIFESP